MNTITYGQKSSLVRQNLIWSSRRILRNMATALVVITLGGCSFVPRRGAAPVEDHSAKLPPREESQTAKTTPLPSLIEERPRAEPLPPLPIKVTPPVRPPSELTSLTSTPASLPSPPRPLLAVPSVAPIPPSPTKVAPEIKSPPTQRPSSSSANTGVVALLGKADDQAASGQIDSAAVTLERALRIEPENGRLWHELAGIRLKQGQLDAAIAVAEKSNSLARNQRDLQASNWRLIAVVRQKQGQASAAAEALQRARALEGNASF